MRITAPGRYTLALTEYIGQPCDGFCFSSSDAKIVSGIEPLTAAHVRASWNKTKKRERRVEFGTAIHALVLEPFRAESQIVVIDDVEFRKQATKDAADAAMAAGKTPLLAPDYERAKTVADRLINHPRMSRWLSGGLVEQSYFARDPSSAWWKARPDLQTPDGLIVDIKTVGRSSDKFIRNRISEGGWWLQAPWHCDVVEQVSGEKPRDYLWVCIEQDDPNEIRIIRPLNTTMEAGGNAMFKARKVFAEVARTGIFAGYPDKIEDMGLPDYAHYRLEEEALAENEE